MKFKAVKLSYGIPGRGKGRGKEAVRAVSHHNADALVYGLWAVRNAKPSGEPNRNTNVTGRAKRGPRCPATRVNDETILGILWSSWEVCNSLGMGRWKKKTQ